MNLSQFPTEVIANLSKFATFTELILLHACGNAIFNKKLMMAPIIIRLVTPRCVKYHRIWITDRFGNIAEVLHTVTNVGYELQHIPKTSKRVVTRHCISCNVPKSVDYLEAECLTKYARFERNPCELIVSVASAAPREGVPLMYITHLGNGLDYNPAMVNLTTMNIRFDSKIEMIPGVEFKRLPHVCTHPTTTDRLGSHFEIWVAIVCDKCGKILNIISRKGDICSRLPPCETLEIKRHHFENARMLISDMSPQTENLIISGKIDEMNDFFKTDGLDLVPKSVKTVKIHLSISASSGPVSFFGVKKVYPFTIYVNCSVFSSTMNIEHFIGIDQCGWPVFKSKTSSEVKQIMARNPRLSISDS